MGNKPSASPFPSYDAVIGIYNATELKELKTKFYTLRFAFFPPSFDLIHTAET